jgi:hypothetical protein
MKVPPRTDEDSGAPPREKDRLNPPASRKGRHEPKRDGCRRENHRTTWHRGYTHSGMKTGGDATCQEHSGHPTRQQQAQTDRCHPTRIKTTRAETTIVIRWPSLKVTPTDSRHAARPGEHPVYSAKATLEETETMAPRVDRSVHKGGARPFHSSSSSTGVAPELHGPEMVIPATPVRSAGF